MISSILICLAGILFLLGLLTLAIGRVPRPWRKFYQDIFETTRDHSVNRNKAIDEQLIRVCGKLGIVLLIAGVLCPLAAIMLRGVGPQLGQEEAYDEDKALLLEQIERTEQHYKERVEKEQAE